MNTKSGHTIIEASTGLVNGINTKHRLRLTMTDQHWTCNGINTKHGLTIAEFSADSTGTLCGFARRARYTCNLACFILVEVLHAVFTLVVAQVKVIA